jgi:hypothetical protein
MPTVSSVSTVAAATMFQPKYQRPGARGVIVQFLMSM